jgi:hypothetical protein
MRAMDGARAWPLRCGAMEPTPADLRVEHVLTMNGRAVFDALSSLERAQLTAVLTSAFGHPSLDAGFAFLETEGMSLYKLRLVRGDAVAWEVWIDGAMDDGAVFAPGAPEPSGIGISQESVHDMIARRVEAVAEIQRALDAFRGTPAQWAHDSDWIDE